MNTILAVNGRWYHIRVTAGDGLTRDVSILDGPNAERAISGSMNFDTIGTFYSYNYSIKRDPEHFSDYDDLHRILRDPSDRKKLITVPFDQSFITYDAYVSGVGDSLTRVSDGKNYWDNMTIKFTAVEPNEVP